MANAVKFRAQVLGQKATHLVRPYRACHCFTTQTQGDALVLTHKSLVADLPN